MQMTPYRPHENGPLTTIRVRKGAVEVRMLYDAPGCHTRLHAHTFDHWMQCMRGVARVEIDGDVTIVRAGDRYLVEAGKRHSVCPLVLDTLLLCVHEHEDIDPDGREGIPLEWLTRLTKHED